MISPVIALALISGFVPRCFVSIVSQLRAGAILGDGLSPSAHFLPTPIRSVAGLFFQIWFFRVFFFLIRPPIYGPVCECLKTRYAQRETQRCMLQHFTLPLENYFFSFRVIRRALFSP